MEDKDEDSGSWKLGMGIVAAGLIVIMSVGATSAGYYGEQKLNENKTKYLRLRLCDSECSLRVLIAL